MKKLLILIVVLISTIIVSSSSLNENRQLSKIEKIEDFECVYENIKNGYPYLDVIKRSDNIDWLENKQEYIKRIKKTTNDDEFIEELSSIISDLKNRHTELIDNKNRYELFKKSYSKNNWYDFLDDKNVIDRYNSITQKIEIPKGIFMKKELILKDIKDGEVGYIYLPSMASKNGSTTKDLKMIGDYINGLDNHKALVIDIRGNKGGSDSYWQGVVSKLIERDTKRVGYRVYRDNSELVKRYTNIRKLKLKPIKYLPEDVKQNSPKEVFNKFSDFEETSYTIKSKKESRFKGHIYVLIDNSVYSSSETFAMFCKETKFARLIGQTTGGDGGGLDPILFKLKNSGLIVRMASGMYLNEKGICDEEFKTSADFKMKNYERTKEFENDNCIKKVLELEKIKN